MNSLTMALVAGAGLGLVIVIFKMLKKGAGLAKKLPINFLLTFLVYAILGLTGFMLNGQIAESPLLMATLLLLVSLSVGMVFANKLYDQWDWSMAAGFGKKLLYLSGICLTGIVAFILIFLLCEHRGMLIEAGGNDLAWWLSCVILVMLMPFLIRYLHACWNDIPKLKQSLDVFRLPIGGEPPFIESGGVTVNFQFIIPLEFKSEEKVESKVAVPMNKTLADAFHYKLHEHNIIRRFAKKIQLAEENKKAKVYGWHFFKVRKIWWGLWVRKYALSPDLEVGGTVSNGETIFAERVKIWEV